MKVKILIVDDDESTVLLKQGYRVENVQARASAMGRGGQSPVEKLSCEVLRNKLEQKMRELERERQARKRCEEDYQQLKGMMQQLIKEAVEEERKKDDLLIIRGRQNVMGEMVNSIAHQWRQPINLLGLLAQDMQMTCRHGGLTPELIEANPKRTMEVVKELSGTIDDLRNLFKVEPVQAEFRVSEAVEKVESLLRGSFEAKRVLLEVEAEADATLCGYPGALSQALVNILLNARDAFNEEAAGDRRVTLRLFAEKGRTVITVSDNAGGIPEKIIGRIFDPFFTTKGTEHGAGIGLFISKSIIEKNMGGALSVRNTGEGAELRIEL